MWLRSVTKVLTRFACSPSWEKIDFGPRPEIGKKSHTRNGIWPHRGNGEQMAPKQEKLIQSCAKSHLWAIFPIFGPFSPKSIVGSSFADFGPGINFLPGWQTRVDKTKLGWNPKSIVRRPSGVHSPCRYPKEGWREGDCQNYITTIHNMCRCVFAQAYFSQK